MYSSHDLTAQQFGGVLYLLVLRWAYIRALAEVLVMIRAVKAGRCEEKCGMSEGRKLREQIADLMVRHCYSDDHEVRTEEDLQIDITKPFLYI
eukprot:1324732-Amorphochlora_amoeboformis.AAC.1